MRIIYRFITAITIVLLFFSSNSYGQQERDLSPSVPVERGGVLLPKGRLSIEPGVQYSHFSKNILSLSGFTIFESILIGEVVLEEIDRDVINPFVKVGYGFKRAEINVLVPWFYRRDQLIVPVEDRREEITLDDHGLGDVEGTLNLTLFGEREILPAITGSLKVKSRTGEDPYGLSTRSVIAGTRPRAVEFPTGNGHWGVSGGFTFVKTSDPAILFLNLGYFYNIPRDVGEQGRMDFGEIDPGDSIEYSFGTSFALNEKLSMSFSFDQRFTGKTKQNGVEVVGSDATVAGLTIGGFYTISEKVSLTLSLGLGLTEDSPDVTLRLRVPLYFNF
jgi:hypothetical protein